MLERGGGGEEDEQEEEDEDEEEQLEVKQNLVEKNTV